MNEQEDALNYASGEATDEEIRNNAIHRQIEKLLNEKNLTREQCEHYIQLIQSRVVDNESSFPQCETQQQQRRNHEHDELQNSPADAAKVHMQALIQQPSPSASTWQARRVASRWTPIQKTISGGPELLKRRISVLEDRPLRRSINDTSSFLKNKRPFSGPDLSPFQKEMKKCLPSFELRSVPRQSTRTARKILETLDKKPQWQLTPVRKAATAGTAAGGTSTGTANSTELKARVDHILSPSTLQAVKSYRTSVEDEKNNFKYKNNYKNSSSSKSERRENTGVPSRESEGFLLRNGELQEFSFCNDRFTDYSLANAESNSLTKSTLWSKSTMGNQSPAAPETSDSPFSILSNKKVKRSSSEFDFLS